MNNTVKKKVENNQKLPVMPKKIDDYEIRKYLNKKTQSNEYMLKNNNHNLYLRLTEYDYFIWNNLDGMTTIQELNLRFLHEFNRISIEYINDFIIKLGKRGFIEDYDYDEKELKFKQSILQIRLPIKNIHVLFEFIYRCIGKIVLNRYAVLLYAIVSVIGVILYFITSSDTILIGKGFRGIVILYVVFMFTILFHETSHAIVCIHYGRKVREAGFMLYIFMPVFYVNTSDIWMENRKRRILVSLAGPICDLFMGSVCSILCFIIKTGVLHTVFFEIALLTYARVIFNLNPLMKWDGYYCLMDLLGVYNLKEESSKFLFYELPKKIKEKIRVSRYELSLILYSILSTSYILFFLVKILIKDYNIVASFNIGEFSISSTIDMLFLLPVFLMPFLRISSLVKRIATYFKIKKEEVNQ